MSRFGVWQVALLHCGNDAAAERAKLQTYSRCTGANHRPPVWPVWKLFVRPDAVGVPSLQLFWDEVVCPNRVNFEKSACQRIGDRLFQWSSAKANEGGQRKCVQRKCHSDLLCNRRNRQLLYRWIWRWRPSSFWYLLASCYDEVFASRTSKQISNCSAIPASEQLFRARLNVAKVAKGFYF